MSGHVALPRHRLGRLEGTALPMIVESATPARRPPSKTASLPGTGRNGRDAGGRNWQSAAQQR
jgi:hypothetical protein